MVIRKHSNKNQYLLSEGIWVRNFSNKSVPPADVNNLNSMEDYRIFHHNELENYKKRHTKIDAENVIRKLAVIVSDGFDFDRKHKILADLPKEVSIIAVNGALKKWRLMDKKKSISFYVVNNPYNECLSFLPSHHQFPRCIASTRTNPEFLSNYRGIIHTYCPALDTRYSGPNFNPQFRIDDYRNPVCAAIGLCHQFDVEKLALFCCDDSFDPERQASVLLPNGLWTYPQHVLSQKIIDANLYWLAQTGVEIANSSSGIDLVNAKYIREEEVKDFFISKHEA
jgi:hypothetical protein